MDLANLPDYILTSVEDCDPFKIIQEAMDDMYSLRPFVERGMLSVNEVDRWDNEHDEKTTLLMSAIEKRYAHSVAELLELGADPLFRARYGGGAIDYALRGKNDYDLDGHQDGSLEATLDVLIKSAKLPLPFIITKQTEETVDKRRILSEKVNDVIRCCEVRD
jgi:hypothetical protein